MSPSPSSGEPCSRGRWKHGSIPVIGLIGGIGSGKSLVSRQLEGFGAAVIDADAVGHALLGVPEIRAQIVEQFGRGVLEGPDADSYMDSRIDRRALGKIVFADPAARRALEAILHPLMRGRFLEEIDRAVHGGAAGLVVLDAAILLEAGWDDLCDRIVFIDTPRPNGCGASPRPAVGPRRIWRRANARNGPTIRSGAARTGSSPMTPAPNHWTGRSID